MDQDSTLPATPVPSVEHRELPREIVNESLRRMGWVALSVVIAASTVYTVGRLIQPGWIDPRIAPLSYPLALAGTAASGIFLWVLSRLRGKTVSSHRILDAGLVVQVIVGLCLSLAENAVSWPPDQPVRGNSSLAVWIVIFALAVPTTYGKALLSALATAWMGPIGLATQIVLGNATNPPPALWLVLFAANFLLAWGAATLARLIYHLAAQVKAAREMGGYELIEQLGRGGMGEVWRAEHRIVGRQAAVKLIRADVLAQIGSYGALVKRFRIEAEATARLHSPHTVALYDYGINEDGVFYYVMELLAGVDLQTLVSRYGPLPAGRAVAMLIQVCDSLIEAHARGLIHRDIKPRNILACRLGYNFDFVKVLDFGLVKLDSRDQTALTGQAIAGTPAYLAPEAVHGSANVDARADIYGLGCVAYWLLTGRLVFERDTAMATALAHVRDQPVPPSERSENEVPPQLDRIVLECLAKDPDLRPQSALDLRQALAACDVEPWTRESAEDWWRAHMPIGSDSDLTPVPATLKH